MLIKKRLLLWEMNQVRLVQFVTECWCPDSADYRSYWNRIESGDKENVSNCVENEIIQPIIIIVTIFTRATFQTENGQFCNIQILG